MSQDHHFFPSVAVVTSCVFPPCCFYGDKMLSPLLSSFSVIQTPLPLPVDKVRTEMSLVVLSRVHDVSLLEGCVSVW